MGLVTTVAVSTPANGTHFVAGERIALTVTFEDDYGMPVDKSLLSQARVYMYGPQAQSLSKTPANLLNASTNRNDSTHHYIRLLTHPDAAWNGNVVTYLLHPITDEAAGTYTIGIRSGLSAEPFGKFTLLDVQLKTATPETQIVDKSKCATCHQGADSGQFYLHHVDPRGSGVGSPDIDSWPVRTCKMCHNQDGYAAYRNGGTTGDNNLDRTPDPIIRRVHGVHRGQGLALPFNVNDATLSGLSGTFTAGEIVAGRDSGATAKVISFDSGSPTKLVLGHAKGEFRFPEMITGSTSGATAQIESVAEGSFHDYLEVVFPANVKACTACHVDDRWKTNPSRQACGACHDNTWFGDGNATPRGMKNHPGGTQNTDINCGTACHKSGSTPTIPRGFLPHPIAVSHTVEAPARQYKLDASLSAPANGTHYVAGETPVVTVKVSENAASVKNGNTATTYDLSGDPTLTIDVDNLGPWTITAEARHFANASAATPAEVAAWLNDTRDGIGFYASAAVETGRTNAVVLISRNKGASSEIDIQGATGGLGTGGMGWPIGVKTPASVVDPSSFVSGNRAYIFVSGPRHNTWPVLTTAADAVRARISTTAGPWNLSGSPALTVNVDGQVNNTTVTAESAWFANPAAATAQEVAAWLNDPLSGLGGMATAYSPTKKIQAASRAGGVATYNATSPHGFHSGQVVTVSGMTPNSFDATSATIVSAAGNWFTISQAGADELATTGGSVVADARAVEAASRDDQGAVATFTTSKPHGLQVGQRVTLSGMVPTSFNVNGAMITHVEGRTFRVTNAGAASEVATTLGTVAEESRVLLKARGGRGYTSTIFVVSGGAQSVLGLPSGMTQSPPPPFTSYASNAWYAHSNPASEDHRMISRTATEVRYQLDDVAGLRPGTYTLWVEARRQGEGSWTKVNFQIGKQDEEMKVATNCMDCHGNTKMHAGFFSVDFDIDICKNCHDNNRQFTGSGYTTWASRNMGFGAKILSARVHGVHRGKYLKHPEYVYPNLSSHDYSGVIFPQDIRNCSKCHAGGNDNRSWSEEPARLPCTGCHDTDNAISHVTLQTWDSTKIDPLGGDELEACKTCHGKGRDFEPSVVHNVANPYKPPYPR